jgi:hypothetical protein
MIWRGRAENKLSCQRSPSMALLSWQEFLETMGNGRAQDRSEEPPPFDFWPYFEAIPAADFKGHDCSAGAVDYVWRENSGRFEHVLVNSEDRNIFMVLVLDCDARVVYGHRLLDLNREYGLTS